MNQRRVGWEPIWGAVRQRERGARFFRILGMVAVLALLLNPVSPLPTGAVAAQTPTTPSAADTSHKASGVMLGDPAPIAHPTPAPTVVPLPDTDYVDQAIDADVAGWLTAANALPVAEAKMGSASVTPAQGARVSSPDGRLAVALRPGVLPGSAPVDIQVHSVQFAKGDPRATHGGRPLAFVHEISATRGKGAAPVTRFQGDAILVWQVDPKALAATDVRGAPLKVYTFDEAQGVWVEVPSYWQARTHQLIARTPHFSLYGVGDGFDVVNNYVPTVNSFEVSQQTGAATVSYPLTLPTGPGGFGPQISLSYNSGNVDRVDVSQQGTSSVGWGWSLSTSYVAAIQHHFITGGTTYDPWTASIVTDGMNGDLVKGTDGYWHTAQESFARIQYVPGTVSLYGGRQDDRWEAWSKDGTHYVFDINALMYDADNGDQWTTNRWLLHTATDVHGNTITYDYLYQAGNNQLYDLLPSSALNARVRTVYPKQIRYGAQGNRLLITFHTVARAIGGVSDVSPNDIQGDLYQSWRIDHIEVKRLQAGGGYALLRTYDFTQDYGISLTDTGGTAYPHLALKAIIARGNDGGTQLPSTSFRYWQASDPNLRTEDLGHLWWAYNGYGGAVGFYYDAAGGAVSHFYRRVRAKRVQDGLGTSPPHNVAYYYDYRGAALNTRYISDAVTAGLPLHNEKNEFRGFAWVRAQDPMGQVTDQYFSQDDRAKGQAWRTQTGKAPSFGESMNAAPPNANWTVTAGGVAAAPDPTLSTNGVWRLSGGGAITRRGAVKDGADVAWRFFLNTPDPTRRFESTWRLTNAGGTGEYWGLTVYSVYDGAPDDPYYQLEPKLVWGVRDANGTLVEGSRDLSPAAPYLPKRAVALLPNAWYRVQLHTSPDGRWALELYRDGPLTSEYLQVRSGAPAEVGGAVPALPPGQSWKFTQQIVRADYNQVTALIDDYTETRTVYSQTDSVSAAQTLIAEVARNTTKPLVGQANNCGGMTITYLPQIEQWTAVYGTGAELGQTKRARTTYRYNATYGTQTAVFEYGDVDVPGDERSIHSAYANDPMDWIIGKIGRTNTYQTITENVGGGNFLAQVLYYYDNQTSYATIAAGGNGDLTKVLNIGLKSGVRTGERSSQQFIYDNYGNQTAVRDYLNHGTTTDFDPFYHSFPLTVTLPNGRQETAQYDYTLDVPISSTDQNGTTIRRSYDPFGRPAAMWTVGFTTAAAPTESYRFPDLGRASLSAPFYISYRHVTAGSSTTWATRWFDGRGRPVQDVTPKDATTSIVVDTTYTNTGVISSTTLPYALANSSPTTRLTPLATAPQIRKYYDGAGRPTMVANADGTYTVQDYSRLLWVGTRDESGHQKWQHTDLLGRMDRVQEDNPGYTPSVLYTQYTYDLLNHLVQVTRDDGGANETTSTMTYDGLGRKETMQDPDMGNWEYDYDAANNLVAQRDALYLSNPILYANHQVFFRYDALNRPTAKFYGAPHNTANIADVKYYYDNDLGDAASKKSWGRLRLAEVTVQGRGSSQANGHGYEYDARGLTVAEVVTTSYTTRRYRTSSSYDLGGRLQTLTYPAPEASPEQVTVSYNTQKMGLPVQLDSNLAGNLYPVYNASYNARGQLLTLQQGSGPTYGDLLTSTYTYDDANTRRGWLTNLTVTARHITYLNLSLSYTANGNIAGVQQTATALNNLAFSNSFTYDGLDRLRTATSNLYSSESYSFDSLGRLTTRTLGGTALIYTYGDGAHKDAPTAYKGTIYSYDANGNQVSRSGGSAQTRTFDPEGRLVRIVQGTMTSDYVYDGNGQQVVQSLTTAGSTTRTLYVNKLYEEQITGSASPPYIVYYLLGGKPVALRRANQVNSGQYRLVGDQLGSTTLLVDSSPAAQVAQRQYHKPYGEIAWRYGASSGLTSRSFTGQRSDTATGLLFYNARFYDPALGFFLAADTVAPDPAKSQSRTRYSYVLNNPIKYTDSTGHCVDQDERENCHDTERQRRNLAETDLHRFGITLEGNWATEELEWVLEAIHKMMSVAGWDVDDFKDAMGMLNGGTLVFRREAEAVSSDGALSYVDSAPIGNTTLHFYGATFHHRETALYATVHELAHAWDKAHAWSYSRDLMDKTNSVHYWETRGYVPFLKYYQGGVSASDYAKTNEREDFAETVAAAVFADDPAVRAVSGADLSDINSQTRLEFVRDKFKETRH